MIKLTALPYTNNGGEKPLDEQSLKSTTAYKLSKFKFKARGINGEGTEEDAISLGESAKRIQVKMKRRSEQVTEMDSLTDYRSSDEHDHDSHDGVEQNEHDDQEHGQDDIQESETGTRVTDVSTAQSNIIEQAEIAERKELEEMKALVDGDSQVETVLKFVLEKLTMQIGIKEIRAEQSNLAKQICMMENANQKTKKVSSYCMSELQEIATTNFKLIQSTIKQDQDITTLKKQMISCETKIQRGTMTLNGIKKTEGEDVRRIVNEFIVDKMKITKQVQIRTAYRLLKYKVALQLIDPNDIGILFKHTPNLKGIKNDENKPFHLEEMLPDHQFELKQRKKDILRENSRMPFTHQTTMNSGKGKLFIGEGEAKVEWKPPVEPQPVKAYLLMSRTEEETMESTNLITGPTRTKEGSKFLSYTISASSVEMVQFYYKKLKYDHQMATHIIGAYRIFGKDHHNLQSFCDDGEHGGGRRILNVLKDQNLFNIAVFIVRYKDGDNIGKARFEIITELAKIVITKLPILDRGERRSTEEQELCDSLKKAVTWKKTTA